MATPQEKSVNETTPKIIETIASSGKSTLVMIGVHLRGQELIIPETHREANQASTVLEGADLLMMAVLSKVKSNPENFGKFITALRNSNLSDEADMLERECCEFGKPTSLLLTTKYYLAGIYIYIYM